MIIRMMAALLCMLALPVQAETVRYVHTDALGSPVVVTDANRGIVERREYEPFGAQLTPAVADGPGYTGHVQDAATGLTYMQQRYYDPQIGLFLSGDPVVANTTNGWNFNRYNYAANNPYKFKDPDGRIIETVWDAANVAMGATSAYDNFSEGNIGSGLVDVGGVIVDVAATIVPAVPGGAGMAIRTARGVGKVADKVADASKGSRRPSRAQREGALERAKGPDGKERCTHCGTELDRRAGKPNSAEIDHRTAYSRGGKTEDANLDAACRTCNRSKSDKELGTEWIPPKDR